MLVFYCDSCLIRSLDYAEWVAHLLSEEHQVSRHESFRNQPNWKTLPWSYYQEKAILVSGLNDKDCPEDVVWHFSDNVIVTEAYAPPDQQFMLIAVDKQSAANIMVEIPHEINGHSVTVRLFKDVSEDEWRSLLTLANNTTTSNTARLNNLSSQIKKIVNAATMKAVDCDNRKSLYQKLSIILKLLYSKVSVEGFGSFRIRIGNGNSPLLIFLDVSACTEKETTSMMKRIGNTLQRNLESYNQTSIMATELCFKTEVGQAKSIIECRIRTGDPLPLQRGKLIDFYTRFDPRIRPFLSILKAWWVYHGLMNPDQGGFHDYGLWFMAVSFLSARNVVPTVETLQIILRRSLDVGSAGNAMWEFWDGGFCDELTVVRRAIGGSLPLEAVYFSLDDNNGIMLLLRLLFDFFVYYATLEFRDVVICSGTSQAIPRWKFLPKNLQSQNLPRFLIPYAQAVEEGSNQLLTDTVLSPICVQDPFDLSENWTGHVSEDVALKFQIFSAQTAIDLYNLMIGRSSSTSLESIVTKQRKTIIHEETLFNLRDCVGALKLSPLSLLPCFKVTTNQKRKSGKFFGIISRQQFEDLFFAHFGSQHSSSLDLESMLDPLWVICLQQFWNDAFQQFQHFIKVIKNENFQEPETLDPDEFGCFGRAHEDSAFDDVETSSGERSTVSCSTIGCDDTPGPESHINGNLKGDLSEVCASSEGGTNSDCNSNQSGCSTTGLTQPFQRMEMQLQSAESQHSEVQGVLEHLIDSVCNGDTLSQIVNESIPTLIDSTAEEMETEETALGMITLKCSDSADSKITPTKNASFSSSDTTIPCDEYATDTSDLSTNGEITRASYVDSVKINETKESLTIQTEGSVAAGKRQYEEDSYSDATKKFKGSCDDKEHQELISKLKKLIEEKCYDNTKDMHLHSDLEININSFPTRRTLHELRQPIVNNYLNPLARGVRMTRTLKQKSLCDSSRNILCNICFDVNNKKTIISVENVNSKWGKPGSLGKRPGRGFGYRFKCLYHRLASEYAVFHLRRLLGEIEEKDFEEDLIDDLNEAETEEEDQEVWEEEEESSLFSSTETDVSFTTA